MAGIGKSISGRRLGFRRLEGFAVLALALILVGGCGDRFNFYGRWNGEQATPPSKPNEDPSIAASYAKVVVLIKPNQDFEMRIDTLDIKGPVSYSGGDAVLTPASILGVPMEQEPKDTQDRYPSATLHPNPDGTLRLSMAGRNAVVLRRDPDESQRPL